MRRRRTVLVAVLAAAVAVIATAGFAAMRRVEMSAQLATATLAGLSLGSVVVVASDGFARRFDTGSPSYRAVGVGAVLAAALALGVVTSSVPFTGSGLAASVLLVGAVTGWLAGRSGIGGVHAGSVACGLGVLAAVPFAAIDSFAMRPALTMVPIWAGLVGSAAGVALGGVGGALGAGIRRLTD